MGGSERGEKEKEGEKGNEEGMGGRERGQSRLETRLRGEVCIQRMTKIELLLRETLLLSRRPQLRRSCAMSHLR